MTIKEQGKAIKDASYELAAVSNEQLNKAIVAIANNLVDNVGEIIKANAIDMENGRLNGVPQSRLDRLYLNEERIASIAADAKKVAELPDVLGKFSGFTRPNGLKVTKMTVPLGVIGMIYESRPNVTVDATVLALKSGNAVLLRGGREAKHSNESIVKIIKATLAQLDLPVAIVQLVADLSREAANEMMRMNDYLDLLIPRGGAGLIQAVKENATVPIIETGTGNCHLYVNEFANLKMAMDILINGKTQRPSVCNALESLLVDESIARQFLPEVYEELTKRGVELRGCHDTLTYIPVHGATPVDFATEYNELILSIKVVKNIQEAIGHINTNGTKHSEVIVTDNPKMAKMFLTSVDAACVYHNASSRFSDGAELGFGAEIGISTQKLHARGPFAIAELTTHKYIIEGEGQIRN